MSMNDSLCAVPYEKQVNKWSCGAAALGMVYRTYGIECSQEQIWKAISRMHGWGRWCARNQALATDALQRGLHALVIQVRDPWPVLERCMQHSVRVIVNHQYQPNVGSGHYSVLTGLSDDEVVLHDPDVGPNRTLTREEFLQLWNPTSPNPRFVSRVLIAIADAACEREPCPSCAKTAAVSLPCPWCPWGIPTQPLIALGCVTDRCPMRWWNRIYCPFCDDALHDGVQ